MDLTKRYPRSVRDKVAGVVMLGRAIDKGTATANGTNGEYNFDCPMDKAVFGFLGIDGAALLEVIKNAKSSAEIEAYAREHTSKKTPAEIEDWNRSFLNYSPAPGSDGEKYFLDLRNKIAPNRTDVTAWPDLLDLDEKREVPHRVAA
jgi:hypothetical protein